MKDLEQKTATKINVPGMQDQSDIITITGTKEGIEKAEHEIRVISDEQVNSRNDNGKLSRIDISPLIVQHTKLC